MTDAVSLLMRGASPMYINSPESSTMAHSNCREHYRDMTALSGANDVTRNVVLKKPSYDAR